MRSTCSANGCALTVLPLSPKFLSMLVKLKRASNSGGQFLRRWVWSCSMTDMIPNVTGMICYVISCDAVQWDVWFSPTNYSCPPPENRASPEGEDAFCRATVMCTNTPPSVFFTLSTSDLFTNCIPNIWSLFLSTEKKGFFKAWAGDCINYHTIFRFNLGQLNFEIEICPSFKISCITSGLKVAWEQWHRSFFPLCYSHKERRGWER